MVQITQIPAFYPQKVQRHKVEVFNEEKQSLKRKNSLGGILVYYVKEVSQVTISPLWKSSYILRRPPLHNLSGVLGLSLLHTHYEEGPVTGSCQMGAGERPPPINLTKKLCASRDSVTIPGNMGHNLPTGEVLH